MLGKPVTQVHAWEACDTACPQVWSTGLPEQGWEEAPPAKGGLTAALAPARAVPGSQEWGQCARSGELWDTSGHSLHRSTTQLEQ